MSRPSWFTHWASTKPGMVFQSLDGGYTVICHKAISGVITWKPLKEIPAVPYQNKWKYDGYQFIGYAFPRDRKRPAPKVRRYF